MRTHRAATLDIDSSKLHSELERIGSFIYSHAYSEYLCGGPWRSCMLWSAGGETGNGLMTSYDPDKRPAPTLYGRQLPYVMELLGHVFDLEHLRFVRLAIVSDSVIIPHRDLLELGDVPVQARTAHRIHIPIVTNDEVYFSERNLVYRMRFGEVWHFDATAEHSVASFSRQDRVHLILDFAEVADPSALVKQRTAAAVAIPDDSVVARPPLTANERSALLSLASVIDSDNYRDIFSVVIKNHFRRDGGDDFVWTMLMQICRESADRELVRRIEDLQRYYLIERAA